MQISRVILSMSDWSVIFYFCSVLTATFCWVGRWTASLTLPKVPSPSVCPGLVVGYLLYSRPV